MIENDGRGEGGTVGVDGRLHLRRVRPHRHHQGLPQGTHQLTAHDDQQVLILGLAPESNFLNSKLRNIILHLNLKACRLSIKFLSF